MPLSSTDAISLAFQHTKVQLFRPFRLGQWTKLALVGLFAGEMSTCGGHGGGGPNGGAPGPGIPHLDPALIALFIFLGLIVVAVLWLAFLYISSRMRFVLFDSVLAKNCSVRQMWRNRGEPAFRYFLWKIVFSLITAGGFAVLFGLPVLFAFLAGWFSQPGEHVAGLVLGGLCVFLLFVVCLIAVVAIHVFTKDFVIPQMALENISAMEGWRRLLPMIASDKGSYAGYAGMKIVLALGAMFTVSVLVVILFLILLVPFGGLGLFSVLLAKGAGMVMSWNVFTVTAAIVFGAMFLFVVLYGASLISVPVIVFFPAFSIYFFASRYQPLATVLYPPAPPAAPAVPTAPVPL